MDLAELERLAHAVTKWEVTAALTVVWASMLVAIRQARTPGGVRLALGVMVMATGTIGTEVFWWVSAISGPCLKPSGEVASLYACWTGQWRWLTVLAQQFTVAGCLMLATAFPSADVRLLRLPVSGWIVLLAASVGLFLSL